MQPVEGDISGEKRNEEGGPLNGEIGQRKTKKETREGNLYGARSGQMEPMMACFFFSFFPLSGGDCIHLHTENYGILGRDRY